MSSLVKCFPATCFCLTVLHDTGSMSNKHHLETRIISMVVFIRELKPANRQVVESHVLLIESVVNLLILFLINFHGSIIVFSLS